MKRNLEFKRNVCRRCASCNETAIERDNTFKCRAKNAKIRVQNGVQICNGYTTRKRLLRRKQ